MGATPEHVLVFETIGHPEKFFEVVQSHPGLEWLLDTESRFLEDSDFKKPRKRGASPVKGANRAPSELTSCVYMVMFNQQALQQLLSMWARYTKGRMPAGSGAWPTVFHCLRSIRRWGPQDRLRDAGVLQDALEPIDPDRRIPVEIELWPRSGVAKDEARVRRAVAEAGGEIVDAIALPQIRYYALLVELPHGCVAKLLDSTDAGLLLLDEVYLFRPQPQMALAPAVDELAEITVREAPLPAEHPVVALLDGMPMENHPLLLGRLIADDPDGWASTYPVSARRHGTAMASLLVRGDQDTDDVPLRRPVYTRPILQPREDEERSPRRRLWLDVIHSAVRRIIAEDEPGGPVAPTVRIVNLSVGDRGRPFLHEPSPLARLLDWLSWRYEILFVVSAGNHHGHLPSACEDDDELVRHVFLNTGHRRLLSPAEAINAVTVGALAVDSASVPSFAGARAIPSRPELPAPYSAVGRGFRRSVKPDVLAPGGRALFRPQPPMAGADWHPVKSAQVGHLVAHPAASGQRQVGRLSGTSVAAALVSRAAAEMVESVERTLAESPEASDLHDTPMALLVKALVVHSSDWAPDAIGLVQDALKEVLQPSRAKDHIAGILGYGSFRPGRALGCEPSRATLIGGGSIERDSRIRHTVPIPTAMHLQDTRRRVTVTLAWFTPINPSDRRYRVARLALDVAKETPLRVASTQVHVEATGRGTVQHMVLERPKGVMSVGDDDELEFFVTCAEDAGGLAEPIPYALAVSIEMAPETGLPIYEQVETRLRARVQAAVAT